MSVFFLSLTKIKTIKTKFNIFEKKYGSIVSALNLIIFSQKCKFFLLGFFLFNIFLMTLFNIEKNCI